MQTLQFQAVIDEKRILSLVLPDSVRPGKAAVTVVLEEEESAKAVKSPSDEEFEELMNFHKGRRLDGITLEELKEEGRR